MPRWIAILLLSIAACGMAAVVNESVLPYDYPVQGEFIPKGTIDACVLEVLKQNKIEPANLCSDGVFIRRVYLDVIGVLPKTEEVRKYLSDANLGRRGALVDKLLQREEFADYWSLKWCDILRVKAEYPINLWPNAVQAYHRWVYDAIRDNKPYDQFARELLTSSGSNFRVPQVNFYRAIQSHKPADIADAAALTFMGVRRQNWTQEKRDQMDVFFSRVAYKSTAEWKEEIVYPDPKATESIEAVFPDGKKVTILPGRDPREVFADWLIRPDNPWFARAMVNRVWSWMMGRGIIHEPDDIRPDNPPVNPKLLEYLEKEFVESKYDIKHLFRLILNSRTYQQSPLPHSSNPKTESLFGCYPVRQLDAEVLIDALCMIGGTHAEYSSVIPEPFTFIPEEHRAVEIPDGSITSQFLEMFGRPARDSGLESERSSRPTDTQRLFMLNSSDIRNKINRSPVLLKIMQENRGNREAIINNVYLTILSRYPTASEKETLRKYMQDSKQRPQRAMEDLAWALINSKEFLYRH